ncbi:MAG: hypothetical protein ACE5HC_08795, partial [Candidatus Binatia bacterium]
MQRLVQHPVTQRLQFANNISSVGGIGFFTHSASKSPDDRYLEVILGVPDVLQRKTDFSSKVDQLISEYGTELLTILVSDEEISTDGNVAGYGLNLSWRTSSEVQSGSRIRLERAVVYISKKAADRFLAQGGSERLLGSAVIFATQGNGTARQFAYHPPSRERSRLVKKKTEAARPKARKVQLEPEIKEQDLPAKGREKAPPARSAPGSTPNVMALKQKQAQEKVGEQLALTEKAAEREVKPEVKEVVPESSPVTSEAEIKEPAVAAPSAVEVPKGPEAAQEKVGEQLALTEKAAEREVKPEVKEVV